MKDELIASTEYLAVRDALLQFRYCDERPVDPHERNLVNELLQLGETYGANGHYIARELEKLLHQVQVMPLTAPEKPNWFIATIEARLKRRTDASRVNLPATKSPEAALLIPLMDHTTLPGALEPSPAEIRARQYLKRSDGIKFQAVQAIIGAVRGSGPLESAGLLEALFWMLKEGWNREFPVSGTVVKFEPRSETGQQSERKKA